MSSPLVGHAYGENEIGGFSQIEVNTYLDYFNSMAHTEDEPSFESFLAYLKEDPEFKAEVDAKIEDQAAIDKKVDDGEALSDQSRGN